MEMQQIGCIRIKRNGDFLKSQAEIMNHMYPLRFSLLRQLADIPRQDAAVSETDTVILPYRAKQQKRRS